MGYGKINHDFNVGGIFYGIECMEGSCIIVFLRYNNLCN